MPEETNERDTKKKKRKRRTKLFILGYLLLFITVFLGALFTFMYFVNSYSPDVDVTIGNNEAMTLSESEMDFEIKTIDERLKWIQTEDEMPSVALRNSNSEVELETISKAPEKKSKNKDKDKDKDKNNKEKPMRENKILDLSPRKIELSEIIKEQTMQEQNGNEVIIPPPIPTLTKVYLGHYSSADDATAIQKQVEYDFPEISPFIKNVDGEYIVQLSSFSNKDKAKIFVDRLKEKGYKPKTQTSN